MGRRGPKLNPTERAIKRNRIVELALRNVSGAEIARREGVTRAYVCYILKVLQRKLDMEDRTKGKRIRQRLVARAEVREREALEAWERSKGVREISEQERGGGGEGKAGKVKLRREGRDGNPAFLREARENAQEVGKLLGAYPAERLEMTGAGGGPIEISRTERRRGVVERMLIKLLHEGLTLEDARSGLLACGVAPRDLEAAEEALAGTLPDNR